MPGLSIVQGADTVGAGGISESLDAVRFTDVYSAYDHLRASGTVVAHTGYDSYPIRRVDGDGWAAFLEGYLHDAADVEGEIRSVVRSLRAGDDAAVREWLRTGDREFLLAVVDGDTGDVTVLSDALGRFPAYCATVGGTTIVSRELKFVRHLADRLGAPLELDRVAIGQQLLFGYSLGTRTPFEGVEQVPPGARVDLRDGAEATWLHRHRFEGNEHADRTPAENAEALASRFVDACRRRSEVAGPNVISLSGGLDSRAVAAGFARAELPAVAATFQRVTGDEATAAADGGSAAVGLDDDAAIAASVARALDIPWRRYAVSDSPEARALLLDMKQGTNYLEMAFILDFFERVRADYGCVTYLTGDGGDKVLADLTAGRPLSTERTLVRHIVETNGIFPPEDAARVAGIDEKRLVESVRERIGSYPEDDLDAKHVHFLIRERGMNWLTHGEDRNRYYFPSLSPFYARPVFEYAMNCPPEQKARRGLYREFLGALSPAVADIEYANFGASLSSVEYRLKHRLYDGLSRFPSVKRTVVSQLRRRRSGRRDELRDPESVRSLLSAEETSLDPDGVEAVLDSEASYSDAELARLYTVVALSTGELVY
ncbi:asparagine synthase-related protein [Halegenticoccus soli]|uniref:asparagine synthase-related protein n=1 Tax=Halegenticoccus soli TaxID=1985678 RepID=UPI000C6D66F1|nr:asparagine synthase-related protein [Halegenticoccus soli]